MLRLVGNTLARPQKFEVITIQDDTLRRFGIPRGGECVVSCGEFAAGELHAVEVGARGVHVARLYADMPGRIGRVVLPATREAPRLDALPADGMQFATDRDGNIAELDDALVERCWGVEARTLYGFGFINQIAPGHRASFCAAWSRAVGESPRVFQHRTVAERVDGLLVPLTVLAVPSRSPFGGWAGVTQPGEIVRVA